MARLTVDEMGEAMRWLPDMTAAYAYELRRLQKRARAEVWKEAAELIGNPQVYEPQTLKEWAYEFRRRAEQEGAA